MTLLWMTIIALMLFGGALWFVWWCWVTHEDTVVRNRIKHRANGGDDVLAWRPITRRERERER